MRKLCFILVPLVFIACTEHEPAAPDIEVAPSFNFMNGPENPGNVLRFEDFGYLSITDGNKGLRVRLYDTFNTFRCNDPGVPDPIWAYQDTQEGEFGAVVQEVAVTQEVPLVVYPHPNETGKPFCQFLQEEWLFKGTGTARVNDSNFWWFTGTGGTDAVTARVNGTVEDRDGKKHKLNARLHYVVHGLCCFIGFDPDGNPFFVAPEDEDWSASVDKSWIKITP